MDLLYLLNGLDVEILPVNNSPWFQLEQNSHKNNTIFKVNKHNKGCMSGSNEITCLCDKYSVEDCIDQHFKFLNI